MFKPERFETWVAHFPIQRDERTGMQRATLGLRGVSESMDGWGCAILALEVVPKNLILAQKSYPKIYFTRFYACCFSKENYASLIYQVNMATSLWQDAKIN